MWPILKNHSTHPRSTTFLPIEMSIEVTPRHHPSSVLSPSPYLTAILELRMHGTQFQNVDAMVVHEVGINISAYGKGAGQGAGKMTWLDRMAVQCGGALLINSHAYATYINTIQ